MKVGNAIFQGFNSTRKNNLALRLLFIHPLKYKSLTRCFFSGPQKMHIVFYWIQPVKPLAFRQFRKQISAGKSRPLNVDVMPFVRRLGVGGCVHSTLIYRALASIPEHYKVCILSACWFTVRISSAYALVVQVRHAANVQTFAPPRRCHIDGRDFRQK